MGGLLDSLNQTTMALQAHTVGLETTARNMANVNNPAYARQRVILGDVGYVDLGQGPRSIGFEARAIEQLRDSLLDSQIVNESMRSGSLETLATIQRRLQSILGEEINRAEDGSILSSATDENPFPGGLSKAFDDFFNAFADLAADPRDSTRRALALQSADLLADRFQALDQRIQQVDGDIVSQIDADLEEVNVALANLAEVNQQIARFELGNPGSAIDLRDQRQAMLEELGGKLNFQVRESSGGNGQIEIYMMDDDAPPVEVTLVDAGKVINTLSYDSAANTVGFSGHLTGDAALTGGSLHGSVTGRTNAIQTLTDELDRLAAQVVTAVNSAYDDPGTVPVETLFDPAGLTASTIARDASVTVTNMITTHSGNAGDNDVVMAIEGIRDTSYYFTGAPAPNPDYIQGSIGEHLTSMTSRVGREIRNMDQALDNQDLVSSLLLRQRDAVSGVSLDEEISNMVKFQKAFQASAKVIQTIDEMLDVVVNLKR